MESEAGDERMMTIIKCGDVANRQLGGGSRCTKDPFWSGFRDPGHRPMNGLHGSINIGGLQKGLAGVGGQ